MKRLLRIAWREYVAYVRTVGFWLSMGLMPVGLILAVVVSTQSGSVAPPPALAMIDLTGHGYAQRLEPILGRTAPGGAGSMRARGRPPGAVRPRIGSSRWA